MFDEKDIFEIKNSNENFETWISKEFIPNEIKENLKKASILLIPTLGFRDNEKPNFPVGTTELFEYFKRNSPAEVTVDICIGDNLYSELGLYSNYKRLGNFLVSTVALSIFLNILSSYIYDKMIKVEDSKPPIQIINNIDNSVHIDTEPEKKVTKPPKKFMESPKVKFSITVVDSTTGKSKDFHYEGPAKDVEKVTKEIKDFWKDEKN